LCFAVGSARNKKFGLCPSLHQCAFNELDLQRYYKKIMKTNMVFRAGYEGYAPDFHPGGLGLTQNWF